MKQTLAQKILAIKANREFVQAGEIVTVEPDRVMSHDNAGLVIKQFQKIGVDNVWNPDKIVIILDHRVPAESVKTANAHKMIREFVQTQEIKNFYDIQTGICHQVMIERGHVVPGDLILGTDSHTTSYGSLGAFSTGIGATEMASIWATGKIWLRVPETIKIAVSGTMKPGVYAKDLILKIIGMLKSDGATYQSVEFYGKTIQNMSVSERVTLTNLSMEMGAKCAFVPADQITEKYLKNHTGRKIDIQTADTNAEYYSEYDINVDTLEPQIACPHQVDNVHPVREIQGRKIHQALLGSCTNGRFDDIEIAANILKGKKVHKDVRMIVVPASITVYRKMVETRLMQIFLDAGCVICNSGCGPCLGAHQGLLADGEICISTTNRNFKGRMGSPNAEIYLASPAAVAASAVQGKIVLPETYSKN
jgi:3-isopropylmalate/(R)-2-methylmalate dehydratase large subunit